MKSFQECVSLECYKLVGRVLVNNGLKLLMQYYTIRFCANFPWQEVPTNCTLTVAVSERTQAGDKCGMQGRLMGGEKPGPSP